jgi:hypothetical protein
VDNAGRSRECNRDFQAKNGREDAPQYSQEQAKQLRSSTQEEPVLISFSQMGWHSQCHWLARAR